MKNSNVCSRFLRAFPEGLLAVILLLGITTAGLAQAVDNRTEDNAFNIAPSDTVPEPRWVMMQSVRLPGRGQVINQQTWKVPVIYSLFAGVVAYGVYTHTMYSGYRAAYYNSFPDNTDLRFGQTPSFIPEGQPAEVSRFNRNQFRNRRDLTLVGVLLVYGLNVADAYIFAHLRDFDVSDDLTAKIDTTPDPFTNEPRAMLRVTIHF